MKKLEIPENVREQVKVMSREGKKFKEIAAHVKETYGIKMPYPKFHSITHSKGQAKRGRKLGKVVVQTHKLQRKVGDSPEDAGKMAEEIKALIDELQELHVNTLKAIRLELVGAIQRARTSE